MKLSIVVSMYNTANQITDCLKSLHNVEVKDAEFLIINDGSTDDSQKIVEDYLKNTDDERFKSFNNSNHGVSYTRNFGIKHAQGDYIIFVDSDDQLENDFDYFEAIEKMDNCKLDMMETAFEVLRNGKATFPMQDLNSNVQEGISLFNRDYSVNGSFWTNVWHFIFRRSFLEKNNLFFKDYIYLEDTLWMIEVLRKAKRAVYFNQVLYIYKVRENSITASTSRDSIIKKYQILKGVIQDCFNALGSGSEWAVMESYIVKTFIREMVIFTALGISTKESYTDVRQILREHRLGMSDKIKIAILSLPDSIKVSICKALYKKIKL